MSTRVMFVRVGAFSTGALSARLMALLSWQMCIRAVKGLQPMAANKIVADNAQRSLPLNARAVIINRVRKFGRACSLSCEKEQDTEIAW